MDGIRRDNGIPAVVYGDKDSNNIILDANEVAKQIKDSGFYSNVIQLKIDKKTVDVILKVPLNLLSLTIN